MASKHATSGEAFWALGIVAVAVIVARSILPQLLTAVNGFKSTPADYTVLLPVRQVRGGVETPYGWMDGVEGLDGLPL